MILVKIRLCMEDKHKTNDFIQNIFITQELN